MNKVAKKKIGKPRKSTETGLQKFTDTQSKIDALLKLEKITHADLKILNDEEIPEFENALSEIYHPLNGIERDQFIKKFEGIIQNTSKNEIWERNHVQIMNTITTFMRDYGRMPTKAELAKDSSLSRQTIHKHIKEYATHPLYQHELERFRFMTTKVLGSVFRMAVEGNVRAARLYFEMTGALNNGKKAESTFIEQQNNYIQINGMVLSQEKISKLSPEQLSQIETIVKAAVPENTAPALKRVSL